MFKVNNKCDKDLIPKQQILQKYVKKKQGKARWLSEEVIADKPEGSQLDLRNPHGEGIRFTPSSCLNMYAMAHTHMHLHTYAATHIHSHTNEYGGEKEKYARPL